MPYDRRQEIVLQHPECRPEIDHSGSAGIHRRHGADLPCYAFGDFTIQDSFSSADLICGVIVAMLAGGIEWLRTFFYGWCKWNRQASNMQFEY